MRGKLLLTRARLARAGPRQPRLFAGAWFEIHHPDSAASGVISPMIIFDHRAPGLERAHGERVSLKIVARVVEHLVGMPVVSENGIAGVHAQHGIEAVVRGFRTHVARRPALLAFGDDIAFLSLGLDFGLGGISRASLRVSVHTVSATAAASAAEAMFIRFFASAAMRRASGSSTFIIRHCSLANFCKVAMCSACGWPKRPCSFKYSDTGRMLAGRKL